MRKPVFSGVIIALTFLFSASDVLSIDKQVQGPAYKPDEIIVKFKASAAETLEKQLSKGETAGALKMSASLNELSSRYKMKKIQPLIKGFKAERQRISGLLRKDKASLTKREQHLLERLKRAPKGAKVPELDRIYKIELEEGQSAEQAVAEYKQNPDVEYAELNYIVHTATSPDDPYYNKQWALNNTGQPYPISGGGSNSGTVDADIDAPEAWNIYTGGSETIVAVIDTGVDYTHRDLAGNMWTDANGRFGYDFVNGDNDPMDDNGHGTHCSGIITARGNNGLDVAGACWNVRIMAVKFLDATGSGTLDNAVSATYYAVDNGADVLSNSWGSIYIYSVLYDAIYYAYSQGAIVVAAAGNDNSSSHSYPANYDHVISVAATDSRDQKASFSNYGEWIDIAAPGVDILSLRGHNTDMYAGSSGYTPGDRFVPYGNPDATMYIASGTSMACPYVSGACALMLSVDPLLTSEEADDILAETADPIADGICRCDGRLNLFGAVTKAIQASSKGHIILDKDLYNCDCNIGILLTDHDLSGAGVYNVNITTTSGDSETVILTEESPPIGAFKGTIHTTNGVPNIGDGKLQVTNWDTICATYYDANDGTGNPATVTDTGTIDCIPPVISNIQMSVKGDKLTVTFDSDEPTTGTVSCGPACGGPYNLEGNSLSFQTSHTIEVLPLLPHTTYYFTVTATDIVGNQTTDSNSGNCYSFTTTGPCDMYVPSEYATIQEAVDRSWFGSTIFVADGNYTGPGNRDIDFHGKAITVKSENGPENCIINCQGSGRGFYFHSGETLEAIVDGFTITNGLGHPEQIDPDPRMDPVPVGGGICCMWSSPTIKNCIITNNQGSWGGGGIGCCRDSEPHISNCIISDNYGLFGGGIVCDRTDQPVISNCVLANNSGVGAGINCLEASPVVSNCLFYGNVSNDEYGGAVRCEGFSGPEGTSGGPSDPRFYGCTFAGNSAFYDGGGIYLYRNSHVIVVDCIFWSNTAGRYGHEICLSGHYPYSSMTVSHCDIQSSAGGIYVDPDCTWNYGSGNIDADPCFAAGLQGDYYLSQTAAGQAVDSPCVNAGSNTAKNLGTTRTDQLPDIELVDMGYHYTPIAGPADLDGSRHVDFVDFAILAANWLECSNPYDSNCTGTGLLAGDIIPDYYVNMHDLAILTDCWLDCYLTEATDPEPFDGEVNIDPANTVLAWSADNVTIYHDVYLGTDANAVADANRLSEEFKDTVSETSFAPGVLEPNTTYYWRIDEFSPECATKGKVWRFTTTVPPGKATSPSPVNGATGAGVTTNLTWTAGAGATSHDVYFGTTSPGTFQGNQTATTFDTGMMDINTTYYWRIDEKSAGGTTIGDIWSFTARNRGSIISWWKFDEVDGSTAYDSAGDNNGTLVNGPVWTTGKIGGALSFDGVDDYVDLGNSSSLKPPLPVTISAWVKLDILGKSNGILSLDTLLPTQYGIRFYVEFSSNKLLITYGDGGSGSSHKRTKVGTTALAANRWYHVAAVLRGPTDMDLYVDAVDDGGTYSGTGGSLAYSTGNSFIGCNTNNSSYPTWFHGAIDEVHVYDKALTAEEIQQLYQEGL